MSVWCLLLLLTITSTISVTLQLLHFFMVVSVITSIILPLFPLLLLLFVIFFCMPVLYLHSLPGQPVYGQILVPYDFASRSRTVPASNASELNLAVAVLGQIFTLIAPKPQTVPSSQTSSKFQPRPCGKVLISRSTRTPWFLGGSAASCRRGPGFGILTLHRNHGSIKQLHIAIFVHGFCAWN